MTPTTVMQSASRTPRQARFPLLAHALVTTNQPELHADGPGVELSKAAQTITKTMPATSVSVFDLAENAGVPLGVALFGVWELVEAGLVRLGPTIAPGTEQAREVAPRLWSLRAPVTLTPETPSARVAVAGMWAEAVVHALGGRVRVLRARMPHRECVMRTVSMSAGDAAVHVVADGAAHYGELWLDLVRGALGVVVTVDSAYPVQAEEVLLACRRHRLPHVVAVLNDGHPPIELVGWARSTLPIDAATPVVPLNLGDRASALAALAMLEKPCLATCATNDVNAPQDGGR